MDQQTRLVKLRERELNDPTLPFKDTATNLVFGEGNSNPEILFLGEAPGKSEDLTGKPFTGAAGKFLDILLDSVGISREEVFITSVVHYRPPNNRDPKPEEIKAYEPYIDKLITILDPKIIITLGRHSLNKFLPEAKISTVHGVAQTISWHGKSIILLPLYHPAAALYRGTMKQILLTDFQTVKRYL